MHKLPATLLYGADIVCMDEADSHPEALLCIADRIVATGKKSDLEALAGGNVRRADLNGLALYPGFIDSHSHLDMLAAWANYPWLGGPKTLAGAMEELAQYVKSSKDPILLAYGYDDTATREGRGPSRAELDAIAPDRPLVLAHISLHAAYVNTEMLKLMDIDPDAFCDDPEVVCSDGKPNGLVTENRAIQALGQLPQLEADQLEQGLKSAMTAYNKQGFTSCIGGGLGLNNLSGAATLRALGKLELAGEMTLRCHLPILNSFFEEALNSGMLAGPGSPYVRPHGIKIITDGSIQAWTAALANGYWQKPELRPEPLLTQAEMDKWVLLAHCAGQQVVAHGNGDAAIERAIIALERAQKACPRSNPHHLLVHCQTVSDSQLKRMKEAGYEPTFFVLHVWNWGDRHRDIFLGPEMASRLDPCGSALRLNLPFSLHADTPVLPQMTMRSIQTAVTRITSSGQLLGPDQRVDAFTAMKAYTIWPAGMSLAQKNRGSIEPGKYADFTVLEKDPRAVPPDEIEKIKIVGTICAGRTVSGEAVLPE